MTKEGKKVLTLIKESRLYAVWLSLRKLYHQSALRRGILSLLGWFGLKLKESRIVSFLCRDSVFSRDWPESRVCRVLTRIVTFPAELLHRWYLAWRTLFDESIFARLAFRLGEETAIAESWLIMLLWVIPYALWNNAYSLAAFAFLLILMHAGSMRHRAFRPEIENLGVYTVFFPLCVVLSAVVSYRSDLSWRFLIYHVSAALCVLVTVSAVRHAGDLKRLCAGGAFVVMISSAFGVMQRIQGVEINRAYVDASLNPDMPGRVYSFFDNPNTFCAVLVMLLPFVLALALCSKHIVSRIAAWCIWFLGILAAGMTYSRAGWVGLALSVGIIVLFLKPDMIPLLLALCVLAIPFLPSAVWIRILTIFNFSDTTTSSRFPLYQAALGIIRRSPITGAGLGGDAVRQYVRDFQLYKGMATFVHAHNLYLEVWIETGLMGIVSFVAALFWTVKRGMYAARSTKNREAKVITCCCAAGLCGIALCSMADFTWHYPRVMCIFWFLFAVTLAGVKVCRNKAPAV